MNDEIREMYKEGFHLELIAMVLNIPLGRVLKAIYGVK
jgi:hypothetical protein